MTQMSKDLSTDFDLKYWEKQVYFWMGIRDKLL